MCNVSFARAKKYCMGTGGDWTSLDLHSLVLPGVNGRLRFKDITCRNQLALACLDLPVLDVPSPDASGLGFKSAGCPLVA